MGVDGWRLLTTRDPVEVAAIVALTRKAVDARQQLDDRLAAEIARRLGGQ